MTDKSKIPEAITVSCVAATIGFAWIGWAIPCLVCAIVAVIVFITLVDY